jgi:hypothetical protein
MQLATSKLEAEISTVKYASKEAIETIKIMEQTFLGRETSTITSASKYRILDMPAGAEGVGREVRTLVARETLSVTTWSVIVPNPLTGASEGILNLAPKFCWFPVNSFILDFFKGRLTAALMQMSNLEARLVELMMMVSLGAEMYLWNSLFIGGFTGLFDFAVAAFNGRVGGNPYLTTTWRNWMAG